DEISPMNLVPRVSVKLPADELARRFDHPHRAQYVSEISVLALSGRMHQLSRGPKNDVFLSVLYRRSLWKLDVDGVRIGKHLRLGKGGVDDARLLELLGGDKALMRHPDAGLRSIADLACHPDPGLMLEIDRIGRADAFLR